MLSEAELVTLTIPRSVLPDLSRISTDLNVRMHGLLERNTVRLPKERNFDTVALTVGNRLSPK